MAALDNLTQAVTDEETVIDSVLTLLETLEAEVRNIPPDDSAALQALADKIGADKDRLAAAVAANTAAAGEVEPAAA